MINEEKILEEITKIAKSRLPTSISDEWVQKIWMSGFIIGYLERTTE